MSNTTHPADDADASAEELLERAAEDRAAQVDHEKKRGGAR